MKNNTFGDIQRATPREERKYYVYMWYKEDDGEVLPVYIGYGSGSRWRNKNARSETTREYFETHNCKPQILAQNLAFEVACVLEEEIKTAFIKKDIKLLDGEHDFEQRKQRQKEGINSMPIVNGKRVSARTGNSTGRPRKELPNFEKIAKKQKEGLITVVEACSRLGISRAQWYRLAKEVG